MSTPAPAFGRHPLKGATPAAWQSQFRGACRMTTPLSSKVIAC